MASSEIVCATDARFAGTACAFGVFDGVHEGHRFIIGKALDDARERGVSSTIITFDRDPEELFHADVHNKLMSNEERISTLAGFGADQVAVIPFGQHQAAVLPGAFLNDLFGPAPPSKLFVGEDFRFGAGAAGTIETLRMWGRMHGMSAEGVSLFQMDGAPVTSTRIRCLLAEGNVQGAARLLGRPYALAGRVESGRRVGRQMGICTANLRVPSMREVPADGVYAAYAMVDGSCYMAAVSIGVPLTFKDATASTIEAHILDFDQDIYGEEVTLHFVERLRAMQQFASTEELVATINSDISRSRSILHDLRQR